MIFRREDGTSPSYYFERNRTKQVSMDVQSSCGHLSVITGYVYVMIHSINGVSSVLIAGISGHNCTPSNPWKSAPLSWLQYTITSRLQRLQKWRDKSTLSANSEGSITFLSFFHLLQLYWLMGQIMTNRICQAAIPPENSLI